MAEGNETKSHKPDYLAIQARILPLIISRLTGASFEKDQSRFKTLNEQVGQDVKALLLEHYAQGYKFVICSQIVQNCGQAGRAGLVSHWDEQNDVVLKEMWMNDSIVFTLTAFIIRVAY